MKIIPIFQSSSSKFRQEAVIGGRTIELTLVWNSRAAAWFMDIVDITDPDNTTQIIQSIRVVPNWLLLRQYQYMLPLFDGDFLIRQTDEELSGQPVTYDNLGSGWDLMYLTFAEAEEWEDAYGVG